MSYPHDCNDCQPMPVIQCNPLTTDDVNYVGNSDSCIPLTFNEKLTAVLNKIVTYLKNRLFGIVSDSLVVTAVNNNCNKYQRIELVPSTNAGNILTLGTDGYPFVPSSSTPQTPIIVNNIEKTVNIDSTGILGHTLTANVVLAGAPGFADNEIIELPGGAGLYVAPFPIPTGFAVSGNTRSSKLGNIEFFNTLTLANNSAVSGETVIIYKDTVENLTLKAGVNYEGFGVHSVGNLTGNFLVDGNSCFISNLTFSNLTLTGFTEIDCSNVQFDGVHSLSTNSSVNNAVFIGGSGRSLTCNTVSKLSNCLIYCVSVFVDNINVTNCRFIDKSANVPGIYFVTINNTSGGFANNFQLIFSNNYIESENNQGLYLITRAGIDIRSVVSNNTIKTKTQTGALVHIGGINENESGTFFSNNTITNLGPNSALILYNVSSELVEPAKNLTHNNIVGNNAYSVSGPAIQSILCGMKNCHGYSENSFGILIDSQEEKSSEIRLIDCTGESKTSNGLRALRDIYVVGGTYISGKDAVDGNPIYISNTSQNSVTPNYYFIAGVKTLAYNTSAYAIVSPVAINAKIVGCIFLNERVPLGIPVEGIDTTNITPEPTLTDAYGNII
jgi:hypothetical protein